VKTSTSTITTITEDTSPDNKVDDASLADEQRSDIHLSSINTQNNTTLKGCIKPENTESEEVSSSPSPHSSPSSIIKDDDTKPSSTNDSLSLTFANKCALDPTFLAKIEHELDVLDKARETMQEDARKNNKKTAEKLYKQTFQHAKKEGVKDLNDPDGYETITRRACRSLDAVDKEKTMVSVCYAGEFTEGSGKAGNKDTISVIDVDGTITHCKLCTQDEPVAKYLTDKRALFRKEDGSCPVNGVDYVVTYLSHRFLSKKNQQKFEDKVDKLTRDAEQNGKIAIIAIALHHPVSQPSAHESEERTLKTLQDMDILSTEGIVYAIGKSSNKTPYARSWLVFGINIVSAIENGGIFFARDSSTDCFQDSMMEQLEVAQDETKWVSQVKSAAKPDVSSSVWATPPQDLPSSLLEYKCIEFTGNCSAHFDRDTADHQLKALFRKKEGNGTLLGTKTLLVVGSGGHGSKIDDAEEDNNYDKMLACDFEDYGFGVKNTSSKKRSYSDVE